MMTRDIAHGDGGWLEPLSAVLDRAHEPVSFFFRDDDVGWADQQLFPVLDLFARYGVSLDLAVIPASLTPRTASRLLARAEQADHALGFHQHGFRHRNHQAEGKKSEFGPARSEDEQWSDLLNGYQRLTALLGSVVDPIFSPPWNRCSAETIECLEQLGFHAVSGDSFYEERANALVHLPPTVDFCAIRRGIPLEAGDLGAVLATSAEDDRAVGVVLHHEVMKDEQHALVGQLLELVAGHPGVRCCSMARLVREARSG